MTAPWRIVEERAGRRCECVNECSRRHTMNGLSYERGRCQETVVLVVAGADPAVSDTAAARLPADRLRAWCPDCLAAARASARRADRALAHVQQLRGELAADGSEPLF